jgi:hypothetical protein
MGSPHSIQSDQSIDGLIGTGVGMETREIPITLATLSDAAQYNWVATFNGRLMANDFITHTPATTASKLSTLTPSIAGVDVTGGVIALTTVSCNTRNKKTAGTAITAKNAFKKGETVTWTGSSTTAFVEGSGVIQVSLANDDTRKAIGIANMGLTYA